MPQYLVYTLDYIRGNTSRDGGLELGNYTDVGRHGFCRGEMLTPYLLDNGHGWKRFFRPAQKLRISKRGRVNDKRTLYRELLQW